MVKDLLGTVPEVEAATVCVGHGAEAADQEARERTPSEGVVPGRGQRLNPGSSPAPQQPHTHALTHLSQGLLVRSKPLSWVTGHPVQWKRQDFVFPTGHHVPTAPPSPHRPTISPSPTQGTGSLCVA